MRILVTGGAGYIGSHAVKLFLARGHDVTVYDSLVFGHRAAVPAERLIVADLADAHRLDQLFVEKSFDGVVHFAAFAYVGESVTQPAKYYLNNVGNTLNLLECVRKHRVPRFVFSSTCATYGMPEKMPITEETPQKPINPYGQTKLIVEKALTDYSSAYNLGFAALRYFNAAGAAADGSLGEDHSPETHLIPLAIDAALGLIPHLNIFGTDYATPDGTCIRDYIHVDDLAEAHLLALEKLQPGQQMRYNLGTGVGNSVREVLDAVKRVGGKAVPVVESPRRAGDPPVLVASSEKIVRDLGWTPKYRELAATVETAWKWRKAHLRGYGDR